MASRTSAPPSRSRKPAKSGRPGRRRTPGRPAGDGPDLRSRLIDVAISCFAREGIAGTSLRTIAAEAAVTPALLHYYFGDKSQLVDAVVSERVAPVLQEMRETVAAAGDDMTAMIAGFVRKMGELIARHPWWPSLWVREVLCEGGVLRDLIVNRVGPQLPQLMAARFTRAQKEGQLNPDLDPRLVFVSIIGLTLFPAAGAPIWRRIFDADDIGMENIRDHAIALLDRGLGLA